MTMLHALLTKIGSIFLALGIAFGASAGAPIAHTFGSVTPVGSTQFTLAGAGINSTQTTIQLSSFTTPDGRPLTMSMFGTIGYGALEPQTAAKLEDVTFSGITQNTNGSATLTGVTRGNDFVTPYAASSTLAHSHAGGATFILTNTAGFYTQFAAINNANTFSGVNIFASTSPPRYDQPGAQAGGTYIATTSEFASIAYVNAIAVAGASNATTLVKGIIQLATGLQAASSTATGSTAANLVLPASIATDTPGTGSSGSRVVMSDILGNVWKSVVANLGIANSWTALQTFAAGLTSSGTATFNGTTAFNHSTTGLDWQLVATSTLSSSSNLLQATSSTAYLRYRVYVNTYGTNSADTTYIQFNNDIGSNYGYRTFTNYVVDDNASAGTRIELPPSMNATTSPISTILDIYNPTTTRKTVSMVGSANSAAAILPNVGTGAGVWNNTTAQISNFEIRTVSGNLLLASTTITVYGSNGGN